LGYDVVEVNFGGKSSNIRYVNKRTEMWHEMADWIKAGGCIPNDNSLKLELATPTYKYDVANRIMLESKDDIKKRMPGGGSPDLADSLALTFAFPAQKKLDGHASGARNGGTRREHDPYQNLNQG
jgi:hypothetical protein